MGYLVILSNTAPSFISIDIQVVIEQINYNSISISLITDYNEIIDKYLEKYFNSNLDHLRI